MTEHDRARIMRRFEELSEGPGTAATFEEMVRLANLMDELIHEDVAAMTTPVKAPSTQLREILDGLNFDK